MSKFLANRANAQLSTGPKTPQGIEQSKFNATRHGLAGKQVVVRGEDPAAYDAMRQQLLRDYAPATEREAILVDAVAQNWWRLQRALRTEAQVIEMYGALACVTEPEARRAFNTITRYLNAIEKSWRKACQELDQLQQSRRENEEPAILSGFVSQPPLRPVNYVQPPEDTAVPLSAAAAPPESRAA